VGSARWIIISHCLGPDGEPTFSMQYNYPNTTPFPPPERLDREHHRPPKPPSLSQLAPQKVKFQSSSKYWDIHPPTANQVIDVQHPSFPHISTRVTLKTPDQFGLAKRGSPIQVNSTFTTTERYHTLEPKAISFTPHIEAYPRAKNVVRPEDRWKKESSKAKKRLEYAKTCAPSGNHVPIVEFKRVIKQ
jgi:hypothetical protein